MSSIGSENTLLGAVAARTWADAYLHGLETAQTQLDAGGDLTGKIATARREQRTCQERVEAILTRRSEAVA